MLGYLILYMEGSIFCIIRKNEYTLSKYQIK
jgi:hypothetical protein